MKTLKELYHLSYDNSDLNSGLIRWYNLVVDKTMEELNIEDVARMVRQDILKDLAIERVIDLFFEDPYDGEYQDGGLLTFLNSLNMNDVNEEKINRLREVLKRLSVEYMNFDWEDKELMELYSDNLKKLERKITD